MDLVLWTKGQHPAPKVLGAWTLHQGAGLVGPTTTNIVAAATGMQSMLATAVGTMLVLLAGTRNLVAGLQVHNTCRYLATSTRC